MSGLDVFPENQSLKVGSGYCHSHLDSIGGAERILNPCLVFGLYYSIPILSSIYIYT